jgi:hypothetical protein
MDVNGELIVRPGTNLIIDPDITVTIKEED